MRHIQKAFTFLHDLACLFEDLHAQCDDAAVRRLVGRIAAIAIRRTPIADEEWRTERTSSAEGRNAEKSDIRARFKPVRQRKASRPCAIRP